MIRIKIIIVVTMIILFSCRKKHMEYYEDGNLKYEVYLKNGEPDGKAYKYYNNGTLMQESNWKNGVKEGKTIVYYPNGKLNGQVEFKSGEETGIKEEYDSLGNLFKRYQVEKSVENGPHKMFNTDGRIIFEGNFINGEQEGIWKKYYDDGEPFGKYFVKDGELTYIKEYNKTGEVFNIKLPMHISKLPDIDSTFRISLDFSVEKGIYLGVLISSKIINGVPVDTLKTLEADSLSVLYRATKHQYEENNIYGMLFEIENDKNNILGYYPFVYSIELDSVLDLANLGANQSLVPSNEKLDL